MIVNYWDMANVAWDNYWDMTNSAWDTCVVEVCGDMAVEAMYVACVMMVWDLDHWTCALEVTWQTPGRVTVRCPGATTITGTIAAISTTTAISWVTTWAPSILLTIMVVWVSEGHTHQEEHETDLDHHPEHTRNYKLINIHSLVTTQVFYCLLITMR